MGCLYCGKEIGAFRLLRDSEFCSVLHRKKYGDRLDKALHEIAVPEPPPAGIAGFINQMPLQQGNNLSKLILWQTGKGQQRTWTGAPWPLTIATSEAAAEPTPTSAPAEAPLPAPDECPLLSERWMNSPAPEPVAAFVRASYSLAPVYSLRTPRFAAALESDALPVTVKYPPAVCGKWMAAPGPEPVAAFVRSSAVLAPVATLRHRTIDAGLQPLSVSSHTPHRPVVRHAPMPAPAPEPVAAFVRSSAALTLVPTLRLPQLECEIGPTPFVEQALDTPNLCERWMPGPAPEPVAAWVQAAAALAPAVRIRLPRFGTELEAAPALRPAPAAAAPAPEPVAAFVRSSAILSPLDSASSLRMPAGTQLEHIQNATLAACHRWMPATAVVASEAQAEAAGPPAALRAEASAAPRMPAPEFSALLAPLDETARPAGDVRTAGCPRPAPIRSSATCGLPARPAINLTPALVLPAFCLSRADTFVPRIRRSKTLPTAEAVMAAILPSGANAPLAPIHRNPAVSLPAFARIPGERLPAATLAACAPPPAAVESWLAASLVTVPLSIKHTALTGAELAEPPAVGQPAPGLCHPVAGLAPAALESFLVPSVAAAIEPNTALHLPPFAMSVLRDRAVPIYGARSLNPSVTKPTANPVRLSALKPIATLAVTSPEDTHRELEPALPRPGLLPVEFHTHRPPSSLVARPEWIRSNPVLEPPRFLLAPVPEKLEEPAAQQKTARKEPASLKSGTCPRPSGRRPFSWSSAGSPRCS